jgi:hypothetical protein
VIATQDASSSPYLRYWRNDPHNTLSFGGSSPNILDPLNLSVSPATALQIQQYWQNQYQPPGGNGNPNGIGYGYGAYSTSSATTCKEANGGPLPCSMVLRWRNHGWVEEARAINNLGGVGTGQFGEWRKVPKWTDIPTGNPLQITARDDSYFEWVAGESGIGVGWDESGGLQQNDVPLTYQNRNDPCYGRKNPHNFNYDQGSRTSPDDDGATTAREHITNRHVSQIPRWQNQKSFYLFGPGIAGTKMMP